MYIRFGPQQIGLVLLIRSTGVKCASLVIKREEGEGDGIQFLDPIHIHDLRVKNVAL